MNAVIFDLDGTLWDAMDPIYSAWAAALERSALPHIALTREFLSGCMARRRRRSARWPFRTRRARSARRRCRSSMNMKTNCCATAVAFSIPGCRRRWRHWRRNMQLFVVSNSQDGYVQAFCTGRA